ncbi:adenylate/guanylate cyclase domain-containing protein [Phyllobacterium brassicacearum]|uniref:Adenylate/guanylate cyclase domain-containing protein n=1 Tax=Phyllobacterium brassicacearum TaxID=314235 RepID=A0A2P7BCX0_9HYPH|nr:adenylate/guanylate cyclase domain-containing protein [Phyllobacterium brassicacearum]PSH64279.1 adenylate/guanylate cyclase domain-containing protein [Phyllobacterium brassicacearum]
MSMIGLKLRRFFARIFLPGARSAGVDKAPPNSGEEASGRPQSVPIRVALAITFGVIIAVIAAALILALESGRQNTIALAGNLSERIIDTIVDRTRLHLDPARDQSEFLAKLFHDGDIDPQDEAASLSQLRAALAGIPQIAALAVIRTDLKQLRVERHGDNVIMRKIDMRTVPGLDEAFEMARSAGHPVWGELLWSDRLNQPLVNVRTPLRHEGSFLGILLTTVTVAELSRFLADSPAGSDVGAFILLGRNHVLAHAALAHNPQLFKRDKPLPEVSEIGDRVLASIWNPQAGAVPFAGSSKSQIVTVDGTSYVFIYRDIPGYSDQPWVVGRYLPLDELGSEVRRLEFAAWLGLAAVLAAVAGAWLVGYAIGKPILRLARATSAIRTLDLTSARPLAGSRLRELDEAIRAYNALVAVLHWFETYVPRRLVKQLMAQGEQATALVERDVTVLFTDIVDFTSLAERLSASDAATFLNDHFRLLAACVEAEGGTIDKYIGDSLMAFWGAPELQLDHSARACRAASAIAAAIVGDNRRRRALGLPPMRIRIGIHAGPAMVGNIGAPGRINYTIVGDVVNTAQRIEEVAKECMTDDDEAVVLVSDVVYRSARSGSSPLSVGQRVLRGRHEMTNVFRLH